MASSSVSQEDVENDFEKLEKRSRIRTARARQINPQVGRRGQRERVEREVFIRIFFSRDVDKRRREP